MTDEQFIWQTLLNEIKNEYGVAGLMGNLYAESSLSSINLQSTYEKKLDMTDQQYTDAVDNGTYLNFVYDSAGYGLAQWTYYIRKANLIAFAREKQTSVGNLEMQLAFLLKEIKQYTSVWETLIAAKTVHEASNAVLLKYEKPANQSESVQEKRATYGLKYYDQYAAKEEKNVATINFDKYINSTSIHYISNSGHDENGNYYNGVAGDQTGTEWELRRWYSRPWTHVFRYEKDTRVGRTLAELGIKAALNDKIGYDQYQRATYWSQLKTANYDPSAITIACEADCSAGVATNVKACGYLLGIKGLQDVNYEMSSRNTVSQLTTAGFTVYTDSKYLKSGDYLLPGDILLYENHHVAMNITKGSKATATSSAIEIPVTNVSRFYSGTAIAKSNMYVRTGAGTSYKALGIIKRGTKIDVAEVLNNGWYYIPYEKSSTGYAYTSNTTGTYYEYTPKTVVVDTDTFKSAYIGEYKVTAPQSVNMRAGAGITNPIVQPIARDTIVNCNGQYATIDGTVWYHVTYDTIEGYVSGKYLEKI